MHTYRIFYSLSKFECRTFCVKCFSFQTPIFSLSSCLFHSSYILRSHTPSGSPFIVSFFLYLLSFSYVLILSLILSVSAILLLPFSLLLFLINFLHMLIIYIFSFVLLMPPPFFVHSSHVALFLDLFTCLSLIFFMFPSFTCCLSFILLMSPFLCLSFLSPVCLPLF